MPYSHTRFSRSGGSTPEGHPYVLVRIVNAKCVRMGRSFAVEGTAPTARIASRGVLLAQFPQRFPPEPHAQHPNDGVALYSFACIQGDTGLAVDFDGEFLRIL